jgi:hypothetical protein
VAPSKENHDRHPFYRQYFDKQPGSESFNFQFAYGGTSPDNLPGIVDKAHRPLRKDFFKITDKPHEDFYTLTTETRMPVEYILSPKRF